MQLAKETEYLISRLNEKFPRAHRISKRTISAPTPEILQNLKRLERAQCLFNHKKPIIDAEIDMALYYLTDSGFYSKYDIAEILKTSGHYVFEIYDLDYNQIYRSFSFLRFDTYDIADLMSFSNFVLYDREDYLLPFVQKTTNEAIEKEKLVEFQVPKHIVWENYGPVNHNYYWEMKLGRAFPIYKQCDGHQDKVAGVFVTHNTKQVFDRVPAHLLQPQNVSFLIR